MNSQSSETERWPTVGHGLWSRWWGYWVRWTVFGLVVSVFRPVADGQPDFWLQKATQALTGLGFGLACAAVFTPLENKFNTPRAKWKTWLLVIATWLAVKVAFVTAIALS
jgi:hypothetical protein